MTRNRRTVLLVALALVLASTMTGAVLTGAATQENTQHTGDSFHVESLDAPMVAVQGETITVTATVSYPENATNGTATAMNETATETNETATDANATETAANATETATDANATDANATDANATDTAVTDTTTDDADAVTQSVTFRVQGDVVERRAVTLAPGESANVTFEVDTGALPPGVYIHGVYTDDFGEVATLIVTTATTGTPDGNVTDNTTETPDGNATATPDTPVTNVTETPVTNATETPADTATETPAATEGPSLDVRNLTAPDTVTVGETVEVSAEVFYPLDPTADDGNVTARVDFRLNGDVVAERNVTLAPGESTNVTFGVDSSDIEPGVYIHSVFTRDYGEVATLTVRPASDNGTETPTGEETETPTGEETEPPTDNGTETPTDNGTATPTGDDTDTGTETATEGTATDAATPTAAETDTGTA